MFPLGGLIQKVLQRSLLLKPAIGSLQYKTPRCSVKQNRSLARWHASGWNEVDTYFSA